MKQLTITIKDSVATAMVVKKYLERSGYKISGVRGSFTQTSLQLLIKNEKEAQATARIGA